jgi:ATP-dependent Lhr-like helicase
VAAGDTIIRMSFDSFSTALDWAHPVVREWFLSKFGSPTEPQEQGWPYIVAGRTTLISAPTGSGKTLAAFLACIERLVRKSLSGTLTNQTQVLYVSPLRALSNDIQKNLQIPLSEILMLAWKRGYMMSDIRTAVRTGDTLQRERQAMLRRPPHILVTTPESLYILLTAEKSRAMLKHVETVIVDEIHAVADDKRGAHLSLSLERLEHLALNKPIRIGLSATQKPIEEVARFLCGAGRPDPIIVNVGHKREMDLAVEVPASELAPVASHELWDEIHERIAQLVNQHRSTLIFVNTRKLAERTAHRLIKKLGEDAVTSHHGSLSRKLRLAAEKKLKNGEIKALVATASLELGIDIGSIDLVCQIGSPRSIAVGLQRTGRSGHWRGAIPKGRFFPTTRDELVECAALIRAVRMGDLDRLMIPEFPLDILSQQIAAICSAEEWEENSLFNLVKSAYPYRNLTRNQFNAIVEMLSEGISSTKGRFGAHLHRDRVQGLIRPRRGTRMIAIMSGGAIPETGLFTVVAAPDENVVGTLDEDFAVESNAGDIILLGNTSWMIRRVQSSLARVQVEDAHGAPPTVPFWRGEAPSRTPELSGHVASLRIQMDKMLPPSTPLEPHKSHPDVSSAIRWLRDECGLDDSGAEQIVRYMLEGRAVLGTVPSQTKVIAERFFDEAGGMQLVIHAPFGARINKAWGLALRKRFCRSFNLELQASATDDGINISLTEQHSFPLADVFKFLHPNSVEGVLTQAAFASPLFGTRWRWDAMRSLALMKFYRGKKVPLNILRMRAEDLLASVFPEAAACQDNIVGEIHPPDHPLVNETMKDVLQEAMDLDGLRNVLEKILSGEIQCLAVDTAVPSAFSHEILNANPYAYLDDAPLEERRARAVSMRRILPETLSEAAMLDTAAIKQVTEQSWPDLRTADELHDVLLSMIAIPATMESFLKNPQEIWQEYLQKLMLQHRVGIAKYNGHELWFAAEKSSAFRGAYVDAEIIHSPAHIEQPETIMEDAIWMIVRGWLPYCGPVTASNFSNAFCLPEEAVYAALLRIESSGAVLRGNFNRRVADEVEWCDRRILARIHRLTLGTLRKQIEPVTAAQFMRWLFRWQHVAPGTQLHGERGLTEILRQLQGLEIPARAWESDVLTRRIADYNPAMLDKLCWSGVIGWGRFSSPSAAIPSRKIPGSAAPITFFLREECNWLRPAEITPDRFAELSKEAAHIYDALKQRGALFLSELVRFSSLKKAEVEAALWELVTAGLVTADGFDSLRSLLDHRRKNRVAGRSGAGRWSILYGNDEGEKSTEACCRMLLDRYGVVFRDLIQRETLLPRWREILLEFRRMEDRGEVRGGHFVSGFVGEQFALPLAVDSLRASRKMELTGEIISISAADPLNLSGIIVPGERTPATSRSSIQFRDGVAIAEPRILTESSLLI